MNQMQHMQNTKSPLGVRVQSNQKRRTSGARGRTGSLQNGRGKAQVRLSAGRQVSPRKRQAAEAAQGAASDEGKKQALPGRIFSVSGRRSSSPSSTSSLEMHLEEAVEAVNRSTTQDNTDPIVIIDTSGSAGKEKDADDSAAAAPCVSSAPAAAAAAAAAPPRIDPPCPRKLVDLYTLLAKVQQTCGNGLHDEEELDRLAAHHNISLSGPWMQHTDGSRRAGSQMMQPRLSNLTANVLVNILSYCDLPSLGRCSYLSSRFNVLTQCYTLWAAQASAKHINIRYPTSAHDELKESLQRKKQVKDEEVASCEAVYKDLEKRMAARVKANYQHAVDVDATLAAHNPNAILHGDYARRSTHNSGGGMEAPGQVSRDTQLRELHESVKALEKVRQQLMDAAAANKRTISAQQGQIDVLQERILHGRLSVEDEQKTQEELNAAVISGAYLKYADLLTFERRMVRIVLTGRRPTSAMAPSEVPVVLRRGIQDFGALELFCMQVLPESVDWKLKPVQDRWAAFKRFFPLNDDYYTVRSILGNCAAMTVVVDDGVAPINRRSEQALLRVSGLVRRILAMRDPEVLDVIM